MAASFRVNGRPVRCQDVGDAFLTDLLRDELGLCGTKVACGIGVCGLCTVLIDDVPASACLVPAICAEDQDVWTIEGVAEAVETGVEFSERIPLKVARQVIEAFVSADAVQCGICTPGQGISAIALFAESPFPDDQEIRRHMSGNLCRCTGYQSILRALTIVSHALSVERDA